MPPSPKSETISYEPSLKPGGQRSRVATGLLSSVCAQPSSDSTSRRRSGSWSHAAARYSGRAPGSLARAAWYKDSIRAHRSGSMLSFMLHLVDKPSFGQAPIPVDALSRDAEYSSNLLGREATKEAHLNNLCFARVEPGQQFQSSIQEHKVQVQFRCDRQLFTQVHTRRPRPCSGVIDQNAAHD